MNRENRETPGAATPKESMTVAGFLSIADRVPGLAVVVNSDFQPLDTESLGLKGGHREMNTHRLTVKGIG